MRRIKMLLNKLKRHSKNEEGAVAFLVAFLMVIMLGCAAFALDYGTVYMKKAELQNAVDIAARATSKTLVDGSLDGKNDNDKDAVLTQKAKYYLKENGFPENKLSKCKVVADVNKGISIDADYDVKMNFARIFDVNSVKVSAATTAVTDVNLVEGKKMAADIVFILDISGSMYWWENSAQDKRNEKFIPMIDAVNDAIDKLSKDNPDNRISVVVFGGPGTDIQKCIMKLKKSPQKRKNQKINGKTVTFENKDYITYRFDENPNKSSTIKYLLTIGGGDDYVKQERGETYTQMGIYLGCKQLWNADFTDDDKETEYEIKRTPVVFLMSDGEANFANTDYCSWSLGEKNIGHGYKTTDHNEYVQCGYYTLRTAMEWRKRLQQKYSQRNGEETKPYIFTLGFSLGGDAYKRDYERAILDPIKINSYNTDVVSNLRNRLNNEHITDYVYNDVYYDASNKDKLAEGLKKFAANVIEATKNYNTRLTK